MPFQCEFFLGGHQRFPPCPVVFYPGRGDFTRYVRNWEQGLLPGTSGACGTALRLIRYALRDHSSEIQRTRGRF